MGKYQTYPEYSGTNTDWLGSAPSHWQTIPVGRLFSRIKRTDHTDKELLSVYRDYGVIPKSSRDDNNNKASEDLSPYQLVEPNDLVMNKMKTWQGSIAISEYEGIVSPAYFVYKPLPKLFELAHPKYVHYLLRNPMYIAQYLRRSKGIRVSQWDLDPEEFQRVELLLPTKDEQLKIFKFLDHETAKIDTLIEKQQQLIKLLKEKRQAVISHAVTKGLNPNAPMRDSGVEWLGGVPEHWLVSNMNYVLDAIGDVDHYMPKSVDRGIPYVMTGDLEESASNIDFDGCKQIGYDDYLNLSKKIRTSRGDVIMARYATIGTVSYVDIDAEFLVSYSCVTIKPCDSKVVGLYLYYYFKSDAFLQGIQNQINTNTQGNVGVGDLKKLKVALPPISEQEEVIEDLQSKISKLDCISNRAQEAIKLMKERRTALISAAVTGKIDVRHFNPEDGQPPEPSNHQDKEVAA